MLAEDLSEASEVERAYLQNVNLAALNVDAKKEMVLQVIAGGAVAAFVVALN